MFRETNQSLSMDIDIIQTLNEISKNENERLNEFKLNIAEYCNNEKAVFYIFRVLKKMELELDDCLNGLIHINVNREVIEKVLRTIRIELDIINVKMTFIYSFPTFQIEWNTSTIETYGYS